MKAVVLVNVYRVTFSVCYLFDGQCSSGEIPHGPPLKVYPRSMYPGQNIDSVSRAAMTGKAMSNVRERCRQQISRPYDKGRISQRAKHAAIVGDGSRHTPHGGLERKSNDP